MDAIKNTLLTNWNFMRILRLGLSVIILVQAVQMSDPLFGLFGAFFLIQALTNTGCCAAGNCTTDIPASKGNSTAIENVEFEEIKTK
jgi:hypothetical protein